MAAHEAAEGQTGRGTRRKTLRPALYAGAFAVAVVLCGCTTTVRTNPDSVKLEPSAVSHLPPRNVTLVNGHASETQLRFSTPPFTTIVEPKQMTDTAIEMLRRALVPRSKGPAKQVVLRVHSPRQAGPYPTPGVAITLDADFGDRTRTQVRGEGYSARGADRSFEAAILTALHRLAGDARFIAYMKR
jgi:hypothetical protein